MSGTGTQSPAFTLSLSEGEREQLLAILEQVHRDILVEVHRTDSTDYRELVETRESVLRSVIDKLHKP